MLIIYAYLYAYHLHKHAKGCPPPWKLLLKSTRWVRLAVLQMAEVHLDETLRSHHS